MALRVKTASSPNFSTEEIPVEFLVLHYTACDLERTLRIFSSPDKKVCAHFVIDLDGTAYDLGGFTNGPIRRGAHAGMSALELGGRKWEGFNGFSIGIELVNFNGNFLSYPKPQLDALVELTRHLGGRFPALRDPERIVGHEQIAGFRGKVDPGNRFNWAEFYERCLPGKSCPARQAVLTDALIREFERARGKIRPESLAPEEWSSLSSQLEEFVAGKSAAR